MEKFRTLAIKAIPNARRNAIAGWLGDMLKVKVHAPLREGRANGELCAFLAAALGLPRRAVALARGSTSRQKLVRIDGLALSAAKARPAAGPGSAPLPASLSPNR